MKLFNTLTLLFILSIVSSSVIYGQSDRNWHMHAPSGINVDEAYQHLLKDKKGETVVVAVIDSGIDIEHEDLKDNIWENTDEIPDNGIDDDRNGYIDDVHGWSFLGNPNGENIGSATLEVTRLYAKYRTLYEHADPTKLHSKQREEYEKYQIYKEEVERKRGEAEEVIQRVELTKDFVGAILEELIAAVGDTTISSEMLRNGEAGMLDPQMSDALVQLAEIYESEHDGVSPNATELKDIVLETIDSEKAHYQTEYDYYYNPELDVRKIVGDDPNNSKQRNYGNNDVEGPDALHGTHVAGIIGAVRNNDIGMNGIATNVKLMSIRAVPDGDERDKDVANAIFYAVDNGASIINMSFGKAYSWDKGIVDEAYRYAAKHDVLLVHAAGNSAKLNDNTNNFPNPKFETPKGFLFWKKKYAENTLEVGAVSVSTDENRVAPFSNYGENTVDIFAPGVAIYSTVLDDNYRALSGTSMASPVVAGVAATLRSYYPKLTAKQVKEIILKSGDIENMKVKRPGDGELVPFSSLSKTGAVVNLEKALILARQTKGKKKIKTNVRTGA